MSNTRKVRKARERAARAEERATRCEEELKSLLTRTESIRSRWRVIRQVAANVGSDSLLSGILFKPECHGGRTPMKVPILTVDEKRVALQSLPLESMDFQVLYAVAFEVGQRRGAPVYRGTLGGREVLWVDRDMLDTVVPAEYLAEELGWVITRALRKEHV